MRDLVRFFEGLVVFSHRSELEAAIPGEGAGPRRSGWAPPSSARPRSEPATLPNRIRTEIVVIGSGPGGAVTACLLAEAGRDVTLIESGAEFAEADCEPFTRTEMELKYRNGGITAALGRTKVAYVEAQCVGGGSEINAGLYHRTPDEVLERWQREFALEGASPSDMVAHFDACEKAVGISHMPALPAAASRKLQQGAQAQGWKSLDVPRLFRYDAANGTATGVRQTMSRTFIPRALGAGCTLLPNLTARRLNRRGGNWVVETARAAGRTTSHEIVCDAVFVCGGAIQTPALLQASGLMKKAGLRMHPTVKVVASFGEAVNSRDMGVPVHQVKEFAPRMSFGCSVSTPAHLSLSMLDYPLLVKDAISDWESMATYYVMTTGGAGSVRTVPGYRDALVRYALTDDDMHELSVGLRRLCELLFSAGAKTLYPTVAGMAPLRNADDLEKIPDTLPIGRTSLTSVHLFSSCPMGEDEYACVTDSFGRLHGQQNVFVADASLLCTAPSVNPQGSTMAFARRNAMHYLDRARRASN